jgi:hypothetical protein
MGGVQPLFERLLGEALDVEVYGQLDVVARHARLLAQRAQHPPLGVHLQLLDLRGAPKGVLVGQLHARLPDVVALPVPVGTSGLELHVVDLAHVAEDVGRQPAVGIGPLSELDDVHPRELGGVLAEVEDLVFGHVVDHGHRLVDAVTGIVEASLHVASVLAQLPGQARQEVGVVPGRVPFDDGRGHDPVLDEDPALAVENAAPVGFGVNEADAVGLGLDPQLGPDQDLEVPEAGEHGGEQGEDDDAQDPHAQPRGVPPSHHRPRHSA